MTIRTLGNMSLDLVPVNTTATKTLSAGLDTVILQARAVDARLQLNDTADAEYFTLVANQPYAFSVPDLSGRVLKLSSGASTNVEIIQILRDQA